MTSSTDSGQKYYLPEGMPAPAANVDGLEAPFWEAAQRHELLVQRCNDCQTYQWGPEWICHNCLSFDMGWVEIEARGTIFSWERAWYPVHPALQRGLPYIVVLIELEHAGNIRMVGNLLGDPEQEVEIGATVEAVFEDHAAGDGVDGPYTLVQWSLAGS